MKSMSSITTTLFIISFLFLLSLSLASAATSIADSISIGHENIAKACQTVSQGYRFIPYKFCYYSLNNTINPNITFNSDRLSLAAAAAGWARWLTVDTLAKLDADIEGPGYATVNPDIIGKYRNCAAAYFTAFSKLTEASVSITRQKDYEKGAEDLRDAQGAYDYCEEIFEGVAGSDRAMALIHNDYVTLVKMAEALLVMNQTN